MQQCLRELNAAGGVTVNGSQQILSLAPDDARFGDTFSSLDLRVTRRFQFGERFTVEPIIEVFNLFNITVERTSSLIQTERLPRPMRALLY